MNPVPSVDAQTATTTPVVATPWPGYADLIEQIMPAVVTVTTTREMPAQLMAGPEQRREFRGPEGFDFRWFQEGPGSEQFQEFMERFFGDRMMPFGGPRGSGPDMPMAAAGSGFIVDQDGLIVTNNHVVDGADEIKVTLNDQREFEAKLVGQDRDTDLAILKIEAQDLPVVKFGNSDQVRVGDAVIAVGNPFGLGGTVTAGIVSAKDRVIGAGRYDDFLQIDAPINRGNSGGPTFDLEGEVIGLNTAIHSPSGGNVGIGFAIPSNIVAHIVEDLRDDGMVERGWLGVHIQTIDEDLAKSLGLDEAKGALVAEVTPDSPAAKAGLEQGDVILEYAGQPIDELRALTRAVGDTEAGTKAKVVVWRDGSEQSLEVEIAQMPTEDKVVAMATDRDEATATPKLGVMLAELTPETREELDLPADALGVVIADVQPGSPAAEKGLQRGDLIIQADRQPMSDPAMVAEAVRAAVERGDEAILLLVKRDGQDRFVALELERA
ncbi:MAG TPA: DegQ family serine endoprotease [Candidatus Limnocylindrales bacterium]|nr:DegQ family serine endoprotease [Candidatus Limnocylindrales bacterium]